MSDKKEEAFEVCRHCGGYFFPESKCGPEIVWIPKRCRPCVCGHPATRWADRAEGRLEALEASRGMRRGEKIELLRWFRERATDAVRGRSWSLDETPEDVLRCVLDATDTELLA